MLKSLFDKVVAGMLLLVLLPLFGVVSVMVAVFMGSPVLYSQKRPGLHGKVFRMYKFRSMTDARDAQGNLLPNKDRLTPFGKFLRKSSLDELPGLLNVLKGDMSLVGPRPLLVEYLPLYSAAQARRHEVKPGITGWAQVNGRNAISWEQKFAYDVWYVEHQSFKLDLEILYKTFLKVMKSEGVNSTESVTMPPFKGNSRLEQEKAAPIN
ncbi:sugar transferase [Pontibacter sp. E15-1]|uniref:sugar transferase n=1 Tax=Pontibacter sp. E15-1 TaxID=2919918 RepID=UPI001F501BDB|nr:sugar transferase [Pontibacter sp. E15-1]MCJ8164442.1 sugar transferase [Pontibacter sp. E15-1]